MEPALDERGDWYALPEELRVRMPQWSPLSTSGATGAVGDDRGGSHRPQWSPLSTSGATVADVASRAVIDTPQWSPLSTSGATDGLVRAEDRGERRNGARSRRAGRPSPRRPSPGWRRCRNGARSRRAGRRPGRTPAARSTHRRNGARSRRAGRPVLDIIESSYPDGPQWSPLSTSGATLFSGRGVPSTSTRPQWSPLSTSGATRRVGGWG